MDRPLHILNASAGSGKTYHLVQEFIGLLIDDSASPSDFKHLIAMTFTNKAALEMKQRIIDGLDGISTQNPTKDTLKDSLAAKLKIHKNDVVIRCQAVLEAILHQYEDFHVMTIDKFNLRLIKSFSRDLDLPGEFEVVLDESELIENVVDDLLNQLGDTQKKRLNDLMIHYAKTNVDEEKTWNFRRSLIDFGSLLKNERHQAGIKRLLEMDLRIELHRELQTEQKKLDARFQKMASELREQTAYLDPKQLHGGGHTVNDISTIASSDVFPVQEELIKKRLAGNLEKQDGTKDIPQPIRQLLEEINAFWSEHLQDYVARQLYLKNFFNMALLQFMAKALNESKQEAQLIRISEFNQLISQLIQDENAPFIYERLGTRYHHFLLDEFQDTSHLQWLNLVPLIHESISQLHRNLIVGDPKQSIYRFKNGVAEQFVALPAIYNPDHDPKIAATSSYFESMGSIDTLGNNWRSSPTIVGFNNTFFEAFRDQLPEETAVFYNAIKQEPKSARNGAIEIVSKETPDTAGDQATQIIEWIETCRADGYELSDLCILGRRNKECNAWAVALDKAGYKVVSSDSLLIDSSAEVRLTIAYLKWRLKPSGENEMKQFAELYLRQRHESYDTYRTYLREEESKDGHRFRYFDSNNFLRDHFKSPERFFFKYEHLYDLIEGFYRIAGLEELKNPYLHHLADISFEFGLNRGPNLQLFLDEYERKKSSMAVQVPAAKDAVNIMTIHKSKGLEFPVVMLPSLNVKLDLKSSFLVGWNDFLIYKQPAKKDILSPLVELYEHEKNQILTDMVNLCYVAMTRPVDRLYIRNLHDAHSFGSVFHQVLDASGLAQQDEEALLVTISDGEASPREAHKHAKTIGAEPIGDRLWFPHIAFQDREELHQTDYLSEEAQYGIAFHLLVTRIREQKDVEPVIDAGISTGEIAVAYRERLKESLGKLYTNPAYMHLLSNAEKVLNEQSILVDAQTTVRPDKILLNSGATHVIDFKTGVPSDKDVRQVGVYCETLRRMELPTVMGYVYYAALDELRQLF